LQSGPRRLRLRAVHVHRRLAARGDAHIHIARARLGGPGKLSFEKWYVDPNTNQGGWTEPGLGGNESGLLQMPSCAPAFANQVAQITYNEAYRVYMMTYVCLELTNPGTGHVTTNATWYSSPRHAIRTPERGCYRDPITSCI
jgi:hypothetical protein